MQRDEVNELRRELGDAKLMIAQLTQQLSTMKRLLQQERNARVSAEFAAQQAASAADVTARAAIKASEHQSAAERSSSEQLQQECVAREQAELTAQQAAKAAEQAARAAIEASRHNKNSTPAPVQREPENPFAGSRSEDSEMEDVSDLVDTAQVVPPASPRISIAQSSSVSSKVRRPPTEGNKKTSLAEARKAAQDEMERRIQERTNALVEEVERTSLDTIRQYLTLYLPALVEESHQELT
ncbi:hypothetical protein V7S43_001596 [Phytophthora oleae]|uniref:Uncharacterized protein n=1 Tax=Phytophthora oleae TaxID=2107226 RepID=A0ABD3G9U1_9STRA